MIAAPGSTLWLLRHELRLTWRGLLARRGRGGGRFRTLWLTALLPVILFFTAGLPLGFALRRVSHIPILPISVALAAGITVLLFTLMLSQTLSAAVDALYERADLDLLFSSPLKPRRVLAVRFLAVAVNVYALFGLITTPILLPIAALGHPGWLGLEAVLFAIALAATGAGLMIAGSLFRLIGPRRTRTLGQVLAAITGAAAFLAGQAYNILGRRQSGAYWQSMVQLANDPRFRLPRGADWILRAIIGEPLPLLAVFAAGAGVFLLANQLLGARFAADAASAAGVGIGGRKPAKAGRARFAASAFSATLTKELRLIARDPALISQVLLRVLYILPLGFVLLRNAGTAQTLALPGGAGAISLIAGQIVGSLAWITISAEDAPDLLSCAPTPTRTLRQAKVAAAILPVAVLLLPILAPLIVMAPLAGVAATLGCAASMVMTAALNVWWQRPGKRAEFRRARQASWFVTLAEFFLGLLVAAATTLVAAGWFGWALIPAILALVGTLLLSRSDAQIAQALRAAA